ncbi:MAG TPA: hypothetical protein VNC22_11730, partial [Sporichthya sp.]|nr:hypothetical protein [Sporichthya sp.]
MAAPHVTGVAALVVSKLGLPQGEAGFGLDPAITEATLYASATQRPCPTPPDYAYTVNGAGGSRQFTHTCETGLGSNGFYGHGVANAAAVAALPSIGDLTAPQTPTPVDPGPGPATPTPATPATPDPTTPTPSPDPATPTDPAVPDDPPPGG